MARPKLVHKFSRVLDLAESILGRELRTGSTLPNHSRVTAVYHYYHRQGNSQAHSEAIVLRNIQVATTNKTLDHRLWPAVSARVAKWKNTALANTTLDESQFSSSMGNMVRQFNFNGDLIITSCAECFSYFVQNSIHIRELWIWNHKYLN